jgi:D-aspartate ligase
LLVRHRPRAILLDPSDPGPGLARNLRHHGVPVSLLATPPYAWTTHTRGVDGRVLGDLPETTERWLAVLVRLAEQGEGVLISGSDAACELLILSRGRLPSSVRSFESPRSGHSTLMNKTSLYELASHAGIRQPRIVSVRNRAEMDDALAQVAPPWLLKPALSHVWRRRFGEERAIVVDEATSLPDVIGQALDAGLELLVSEYIPGPVRDIETAVIVRREDGTLPLAYTKRKLYQHPELGAGTVHETCDAPSTFALAERLLAAADFVGVASVEAKRHAETGETVLIEANVRVPQSFGLGDAAGADASWRLYAALAGLPLGPQPRPRQGVRSVVVTRELKALLDLGASPRMLRRRFAAYRGVRDVSGIYLRDPRLTLSFVDQLARAGLRRARRASSARRARRRHE